jgi:hypothetical protein
MSVSVHCNGDKPAVAVNVQLPGHLHEFTVSDNYFWLNSGETKVIVVNRTEEIRVDAWNSI